MIALMQSKPRIRYDSKEGRAMRRQQTAVLAASIARYCATGRASIRALSHALGASQQLIYAAARANGFVIGNDGVATYVSLPEPAQAIPHTPPEWVKRMRAAPQYRRLVGAF
jgi:hypothetical protein